MTDLLAFDIPYSYKHLDGEAVKLLTGDAIGRRAFDSSVLGDFELKLEPQNLFQSHVIVETESEYKNVQEASLGAEGSKSSIKVGLGLDLMLSQTVTNKNILAVSLGDMVSGILQYDPNQMSLSNDALDLLESDVHRFVETYGTHFIGGYVLGATFRSVIDFKMISTSDRSMVKSKLSGSYNGGVTSASGTASYSQELSQVYSKTDRSGKLYTTGFKNPIDVSSVDSVREQFRKFAETASESTTRIKSICYPYTILDEVQDVLNKENKRLIPEIPAGRISNFCLEFRNAKRAEAVISSYDHIANERGGELQYVNRKYKADLNAEMDEIRNLKPNQLASPPAELLSYTGHNSHAVEILNEWKVKFKEAYYSII